jgi:hypothetical protein
MFGSTGSDREECASIEPHRAPELTGSETGPTLVLLAAGLGSRFGGIKPLAPVGPDHEPLIVISLAQAASAGFRDAVLVVSEATEHAVAAAVSSAAVPCRFVRQDVATGRTKPLGTVDAVSRVGAERDVVVANGDDLYGEAALRAAYGWSVDAAAAGASGADGAAVLFVLDATLTDGDGVSRGVVELGPGGHLMGLAEHRDVLRRRTLMELQSALAAFAAVAGPSDELGLPVAIDDLIRDRRVSFDAMVTDSPWHGVTWPADVEVVRARLMAEANSVERG